ncbi:biopolymer transporter ExbD [Ramlibacter tataouinensis]|uniref:ExbD/TolR family protein n=1 Tax=Ramlibacter tataouinensis TaxID=94132 RepID=UPI0022F3F5AE|nr:biopolymer transporter ExbD [Ramlibacter tataouinensis]WBY03888.1 biopolymer transporter ExbD [Ramlibacter tataouinensis]
MAFGRLERSEAPRPISDINVTPLVDVMLVLVVILIITAPLMASSLRLDLPQAEAAQPTDAPRFVTVGIAPQGHLFLDDKPVSAEQLAQGLARAAGRSRDTEVQLRADRTVPYGTVVEVMGAAQKAGLNRIGFVAEPR